MTIRRLPIGVEYDPAGLARFRVWAPRCRSVAVVLGGSQEVGADAEEGPGATVVTLEAQADGYWSGETACPPGTLYRFHLDDRGFYPDPVSRFQPAGPHGPSQIVDASAYHWRDAEWPGLRLPGQLLYEMHIGTYTTEGTYAAAAGDLERLAEVGITCLEVMPLADFVGRFGWGYDGVDLFAPCHLYGRPDDLRAFVDRAHGLGLGVILDVVYNHFGLEGNYLPEFCGDRFESDRYENEWGRSLDFEGPEAGPVREFFVSNAAYWLQEFHFDGFRLDATQAIKDASPEHVLSLLSRTARAAAGRPIVLVGENEPQDATALAEPPQGWGLDAMWNDDFHHAARVALTGRPRAYLSGYQGSPQELISSAKYSFLYQGQYYQWQKQRRGSSSRGLAPWRFVDFLQNHDQTANSAYGERVEALTSPGRYRALTALFLLLPQTPLLFQGQEFGSRKPFMFFADMGPELRDAIRRGRRGFMTQFPELAASGMADTMADPGAEETFLACKLETGDRRRTGPLWRLHQDLLALRRSDPVFSSQAAHGLDGAVLGPQALALRFFAGGRPPGDRLLLLNLGTDLVHEPAAEPLLAPPRDARWTLLFSTERPDYGGSGTWLPEEEERWLLPGETTVVLQAVSATE